MASRRDPVEQALVEYVRLLEKGASTTTRAEDRPKYRDHLAQAALMFAALRGEQADWTRLREVIASEARAFGWSYLSDAADAEAAFCRLRELVPEK